jgi:hypothetical protein
VLNSPGVALSLDVFESSRYRFTGLATPPRPWRRCQSVDRQRWTSRSSLLLRSVACLSRQTSYPSTEFIPPSELDHPSAAAPVLQLGATGSHEVSGSFSTCHTASPLSPGLPHPVRSAFRVSHPPDGLLLAALPGLVSCRSAHGVPCPSELFPRPEPWRLSTLDAFLSFTCAAR